ncbi:general odorant-binding protein lush [Drosophila sulfurigaster albostrigata]|uniref:general odorant-binding protein lush n=1 Tax=Drosophila sulfurigaster albostrigata TaxID=89887 RepID=UPI002D2198EF|nr:general odorant-binding protein lush [Drosophila sulfurigaster albostrigata]
MRLNESTSASRCSKSTCRCMSYQLALALLLLLPRFCDGVNMQQFIQSLDMMRNGCMPKFKVQVDQLDRIRDGDFSFEPDQDLQCYMKCVAQLAGTLTKKGEFSVSKAQAQMPIILPAELQEPAKVALNHCKDAQKEHKDTCAKVYYISKCMADFDRANFKFP